MMFLPVMPRRAKMGTEMRVQLAEDGADAERIDLLTRRLRDDLRGLGAEVTAATEAGPPPAGTRGFDVAAVGGLLVSLQGTAAGLRPAIEAVREWLSRGHDVRRTVRLEVDGDVLELSHASASDQARVIDFFVDRHSS
jgi:hypothetical protein